jgi:hypothetical protein
VCAVTFEKRKNPRRPLEQGVAILRADGSLVCECVLSDISNDGARLKLSRKPGAPSPEIPPKFILSLSKRGNLFRNCEFIWHENDEVGLRFVATKAS